MSYPDNPEQALESGKLPLRHFPRAAEFLGLASPNELLLPGKLPQVPLRDAPALKLWLETVKVLGVSGDAPTELTEAMVRIADASTPGKSTLRTSPSTNGILGAEASAAGFAGTFVSSALTVKAAENARAAARRL